MKRKLLSKNTFYALTLLGASALSTLAQPSSSIQFFDTTGTNKTANFGWQGDQANGNFFIETPNDGNGLTIKDGNLNLDGNITSTKNITANSFIGNGSQLTNLPSAAVNWGSVTGKPLVFPPETHSHSVGWNDVANKPTTFTPSTHTHTKSQITDLPATLVESVSAGTGLSKSGTAQAPTLSVNYGGNGSANSAARSDHNHNGTYSTVGHGHTGTYSEVGHKHSLKENRIEVVPGRTKPNSSFTEVEIPNGWTNENTRVLSAEIYTTIAWGGNTETKFAGWSKLYESNLYSFYVVKGNPTTNSILLIHPSNPVGPDNTTFTDRPYTVVFLNTAP